VALSVVRQERKSGGATASVGGWRTFSGETDNCWCGAGPSEWGGIPPAGDANQQNRPGAGDIYSVPQNIGYELADYDRVRNNGQLTLQFRPVDSVTATLDYTYSEFELDRSYNNLSAWFNFAGQETLWTDGPNATPLTYSETNNNGDFAMGAGTDAIKNQNKSLGFNVGWQVTDRLFIEADYHDSSAENKPNSPLGSSSLLSIAAFTRNRTTGYFGQDMPILELGLNNPLSPDDMIVTGSVFQNQFSKMDINQGRLSGNLEFDASFVKSIDFGLQFTDVDNRSAGSVVQRDAWGGVTQPGAIADLMIPANLGNSFNQVPGGNDPRIQSDYYIFDTAALIARTEALIASGDATLWGASGGDNGPCGTALCPTDQLNWDRLTTEKTKAAYVQMNMATEWGDMPVDMRLGLRYEQTDVVSDALAPNYTNLVWVAGNELALISNGTTYTQGKGDYSYLLPNFDFSIDVTENLKARASLSRTLARPGYIDIQGGLSLASPVRITGGTGSRGNPALKPYVSDNLDLSLEWYYGNGSYVAAGYFRKDVSNFIGTGSVNETAGDLPHPALGPLGQAARDATGSSDGGTLYTWICNNRAGDEGVNVGPPCSIAGVAGRDPAAPFDISIPVNIESAVVDGWELVVQHNFGETGFGVIANVTLVDANVGYDNLLCEQPNCNLSQQFVVTGLSDSANLIAYYEKHGIGVRVAYNWRDKFLAGTGQNNVGVGPPTYVDAYGQWDLNASYEFNDHLIVFADVLNLTNETTYVFGRADKQVLFASQLGTRYNLGVRYKF
jgi:TonB-dependent receptor